MPGLAQSGGGVTNEQALTFVHEALRESARVKESMLAEAAKVVGIAAAIAEAFRRGAHLYACGNGGSACDAMHLVEELVARYKRDRPGLPAHHLLDAPTLTCWSNDFDFTTAFQRQVETLVREGDVLVAISTSGNSRNVLLAVEAARQRGAWTLGLTGAGGRLAGLCHESIVVPSSATERVQEAHITVIHLLCELIEDTLFAAQAGSGTSGKVNR
jgi:D-sedoheptulose 7-phosphate isomerase